MPEVPHFIAEGVGNGFPFCLPKVDVSGFSYVAPMTLNQAMNVFWNLYSVTSSASVTATASQLSVSDPDIDTRTDNGVDQNPPNYTKGDREPRKRLGGSLGGGYKKQDADSNFYAVAVAFDVGLVISRMYDGSTSDEDNFIGYGFGDDADATEISYATAGEDAGTVGARVALYSWAEEGIPSSWWFNYSVMGTPDTVTVTALDGIPTALDGIPVVKAEWTSFIIGDEAADITGLNFYTYPA